jgi:uncharacterized RDD family membrane protein YckC
MVKANTVSKLACAFLAPTRHGVKNLVGTTRQWERAQAIITSCDEIAGEMKKMSTGSSSQFDMNHWLLRLIAFIIDSIIIGIVAGIIWTFVILSLFFGGGFWWFGWEFYLGLPFLLGILELLYFMFMEASYGATLGKRVLGLQVQMVNGSKVTFDKAFIRNISKIFWLFLLLDWILGVATPGHDQRQKYTDRIAGTTVVSVKQAFSSVSTPPPPPPPPPAP